MTANNYPLYKNIMDNQNRLSEKFVISLQRAGDKKY